MKRLLGALLGRVADDGPTFPSMSPKEAIILRLLVAGGEMYGLQIVDSSEGAILRTSVYVQLNRMEDKGLIESRTEAPMPGSKVLPKRLYKLTGHGASVLRACEMAALAMAGEVVAT